MNSTAGCVLEILHVYLFHGMPGLHREAQEPLAVAKNLLTALNNCSLCLYYIH